MTEPQSPLETTKAFISGLQEDFQEALVEVRKELGEDDLKENRDAWLSAFSSMGLPTHLGAKATMLATLHQVLALMDALGAEEFEDYGWSIFLSLLEGTPGE